MSPHWCYHIAIFVLIGVPADGDHATAEFSSPRCVDGSDHFVPCGRVVSVLQSRVTRDIYVALQNGLYEFDEGFLPKTFVFTSTAPIDEENVNALMALTDSHVILCRKDDDGSCELRDLSSLDLVDGFRQNGVVDHRGGGNGAPLAWIGNGPRHQGVLHVALSTKGRDSASAPILSTRYLAHNSSRLGRAEDFLAVVENEYFVPSAQWPSVHRLTVDIEPLYGFSDENYDYLLKRQTSLLDGVIETKLIRLCRRDVNYRSYIELNLQCVSTNGEVYENASSAIRDHDESLLVSFQSTGDGVSSAVCRFNLSRLNERYQQRRRECLSGGTPTAEIDWYQEIPCPSEPISHTLFNISTLDDPDFCYDLDVAHPLGSNRPVSGDALLTIGMNVGAIAVGHYQGDSIYFLGDDHGKLAKMRWRAGIWETEMLDIGDGAPVSSPGGLMLGVDGDAMYVITDRKVKKLPVDFKLSTVPPMTEAATTMEAQDEEMTFEPYVIYIICGAGAILVVVVVIFLGLSIKYGLRKYYKMSLG